ncbi:LamG-like jellyroll fold domain-containing protein [Nonomuraea solani]
MLVQSQNDVVRVLPALPSAWRDGSVSGLRARGDVTVDATWKDGAPDTVTVRPGRTGPIKVASPFVAGRYRVFDERGHEVGPRRDGDTLSWNARAGKAYTIQNEAAVALKTPATARPGTPFEAQVTVTATRRRSVPASDVALAVPQGWTVEPATRHLPGVAPGRSRTAAFTVTPGPADGSRRAVLSAAVTGSWQGAATAVLALEPCAPPPAGSVLVAWDPKEGGTVADTSGNGRHATVTGTAAYDATAPTGSGLTLDGDTYLTTAGTTLGLVREATFAAEVKIAGSGYRRLFDSQRSGDPGTDGVLIDVTPAGTLRFIGAGANVGLNTTLPTGRWIDLVVTLDRSGAITVYVDGERKATGQATSDGITGCTARPLRFGADQGGGQRLTGAVDRAAILARALTAGEVPNWRRLAF